MWGYGPNWGMMGGGWGLHSGYGPFGMIIWVLFIAAVIVGVVWLVRAVAPSGQRNRLPERRAAGLDLLEERYARGEINRDEFLQKKRDILG